MRTVYRNTVAVLIFSKDGKILQAQRHPKGGGVYADGYWHIPGGGIEEDETMEQAVVREVQEEVGIDVSPYEAELVDDAGKGEAEKTLPDGERILAHMKFNIFKIVINDKNADEIPVHLGEEFETYQWTDPKEFVNIKLTPPSVELFKRLGYL